jgi:tellurite resistance protein
MGELLVPILLLILPPVVVILPRLLRGRRLPVLCRPHHSPVVTPSAPPDPTILNCRVELTEQKQAGKTCEAFSLQICGTIHAPDDMHPAHLQISITDVTDGLKKVKPVHSTVKQWQRQDTPDFFYTTEIGKLPNQVTELPDWTSIAGLDLDWLSFPGKGKRDLQFHATILSARDGDQLASAECFFTYENPAFGYLDARDGIQHAKTMAVALAFAVASADTELADSEVAVIENWATGNITSPNASGRAKRKLDKAMDQAIHFFRNGNQINICETCMQIAKSAPLAERYDIMELCLYVSRATGSVTAEEMNLLKILAQWLELDKDRFRRMVEKILPVSMHQVNDVEVTLGVTVDMDKEMTRRQLNREYSKWHARVTNSDPEIQNQADKMLKLIAEARSEYVG